MLGLAREYRLFNGRQIIGILKNDFWNRKAYGEFKGFLVRFEHQGMGKKKAWILDIEGEKVLGTIEFSTSPRSATITYDGEGFNWNTLHEKPRGSWLVGNGEEESRYLAEGSLGSQGKITDAYLPPVVLLAGLYVRGYFLARRVSILAGLFFIGLMMGYMAS
ncbi:hypothetical protein GCM10007390_03510 [Persicitalea jodogahamensis]|uniref:Uncharacterized protein n=2 Tax=Persicitalea jodogahamensis TaxID=402147 RepID=A0A8J3D6Q2_9BACT|nr:hypothetical protein GCM10007390_03510 [Persicitalea jodogahamensis]